MIIKTLYRDVRFRKRVIEIQNEALLLPIQRVCISLFLHFIRTKFYQLPVPCNYTAFKLMSADFVMNAQAARLINIQTDNTS